jgi:uncharacterized membrane protein
MLTFVYFFISWVFSVTSVFVLEVVQQGLSTLVTFFLMPLTWGFCMAFLLNRRGVEDPFGIGKMFAGYKDFIRIFTTMFLEVIYVLLWTSLFIVPGIIKGFSYAMTPFILFDCPEKRNNEAIELSMKMMDGHKMELFILCLIGLGLVILSVFTLFIGLLWIMPWLQVVTVKFYLYVKEDYESRATLVE